MSTTIRLAIGIPQTVPDAGFDPGVLRSYLQRVEALGCFESVWDQEQILGAQNSLEPLHLLTYAAACTQRVRLGCAVILAVLRSPVHLAKELATLDVLSQGRLIVGLGLGAQPRVYPAFGVDPATRVARFTETVRIMKALWTEPKVTLEGRFWKLEDVAMAPKPVQQPHLPIYFGGNAPGALKRAAMLGDGFIGAGSQSTADFANQARTVLSHLEEAGKDPATFDVGKRVYIGVDDDRDRAWGRLGAWFQSRYGRSEPFKHVAVYGSPAECVEQLHAVAAGGAKFIQMTPLYDETEQMERIAADIVTHL